jgi:putative membrane protein
MDSSSSSEPPTQPQVLAAGHLHPGMLFLRFVDGLRQAVLPVLIGLLTGTLWITIAAGVFFVLSMVWAVARYLTFQYRLTAQELVTTEGILHRQERRIPVSRVQDLSFESTLVRRIFGLVVVSVETASAQGAEAKLDSLSRRDAERLREALYRSRGQATPAAAPAERLVYRASGGELALRGLTTNRVGVIVLAALGLLEVADELGMHERLTNLLSGSIERLLALHWSLLALFLTAVLFVALLGGWVISVAASFVMFHDFKLTEREGVLQRRYGLITTRAATLPRRKVQRVLLESTFLRRLLRLVVVRADSAGSGMDPREEQRGGRDVIAPLTRLETGRLLVPWLLRGCDPRAVVWQPVSPRVIVRVFLKGAVLATALGVAAFWSWPWLFSIAGLLVLPIAYAIGLLSYHNLAHAQTGDHLALRWGILGRYRAYLPLDKVQGVAVRRTPLDRLLRLARVTVYVAGGNPTTISNLPREAALELQDALARQAAATRFVW